MEGQGRNREEATAGVQASNDTASLHGSGEESRRVGRSGMCYLREMSAPAAGSSVGVRRREEPRCWA